MLNTPDVERPDSFFRGHIPALDGLRGLAIAMVMVSHFIFRELFSDEATYRTVQGGWLGVDMFFVLSGFLITRVLWHGLQSSRTIDFSAFYARRVLRLLPAFLLVGLCCLLLAPYFLPPFGEVQRLAKSGVSAAASASRTPYGLHRPSNRAAGRTPYFPLCRG